MLQEVGKDVVGSGKTIAIQNFVENSLTVFGLIVYLIMASNNFSINLSVFIVGSILLLFVAFLSTQVGQIKKESGLN
jgi:LPLT family lysophospholipid transporter-like MFS transporter